MNLRIVRTITLLGVGALIGGGGAFAAGNMITSAQIKNGTIQLADISPAARAALRGQQGVPGATGLPGASVQGAQGLPGSPGVSGLQLVSSTVSVGGISLTASCPAGKQVLSGGGTASSPVIASYPSSDLSGWNVVVSQAGSQITAYAVCAVVAS